MIGTIYINGVIGEDCTLLDVIKQVKAQSGSESFLVKIDSVGGYVDAGYDIYNYLKNLAVPVTTYTTKAYSIASVIFMAGQCRVIPQNTPEALMIHLPWVQAEGNSIQLATQLESLKEVESEMIAFYSKAIDIDKATIQSLLNNETFLNDVQAFDLGFATSIQPLQKAVALLNNKEEEKEENLMNKITKKLDAILAKLTGVKAELILQDVTGVELVFPELDSTDKPAADAKVMVDGKPADGEYITPDYVVSTSNGVVTEVKEAEAPKEDAPAEGDELNADDEAPEGDKEPKEDDSLVAELEAKIAELQAKIDELMNADQTAALLDALQVSTEKQTALEAKFTALAKHVGSDFSSGAKETKTTIKASAEGMSRAAQILNSKY